MGKQLPIEIFMPPNVLRAKVGRTSRDGELSAVMRAEAAVEALKVEFTSALAAETIDAHVGAIHAALESKPETGVEELEARVAQTTGKTS